MLRGDKIWMGQGEQSCYLLLNQANRHGLITGASGTGKTVTLKVMAEGFSHAGVPVFMADAVRAGKKELDLLPCDEIVTWITLKERFRKELWGE